MGRIATLVVALGFLWGCGSEPQQQWRQVLGSGSGPGGNQLGTGSGPGGRTLGSGSGPGGSSLGTGSGSGGKQLGTGGGGGGPTQPPGDGGPQPPGDGGTRQATCPDVCDYLIECGASFERGVCISGCQESTTAAQLNCAAAAPNCSTLNGCFGS